MTADRPMVTFWIHYGDHSFLNEFGQPFRFQYGDRVLEIPIWENKEEVLKWCRERFEPEQIHDQGTFVEVAIAEGDKTYFVPMVSQASI